MNTTIFEMILIVAIVIQNLIWGIRYQTLHAKKNGLESQLETISDSRERLEAKLAEKIPSYIEMINKEYPDLAKPKYIYNNFPVEHSGKFEQYEKALRFYATAQRSELHEDGGNIARKELSN